MEQLAVISITQRVLSGIEDCLQKVYHECRQGSGVRTVENLADVDSQGSTGCPEIAKALGYVQFE